MRALHLSLILCVATRVDGFSKLGISHVSSSRQYLSKLSSSNDNNSDMFGGSKEPAVLTESAALPTKSAMQSNRLKDEAMRLRREAEEMEIALREEARAKGLPQDVIDKLVPMRPTSVKKASATDMSDGNVISEIKNKKMSVADVRSKLGYLNTGDAVRITSELDRIKAKGSISLWNSKDISKANFAVNNLQLTSKTGIEPVSLRLDAVGFEYQKVFAIALVSATILGLGSNYIGGQIGFLMGYASALFPILLVGVGSIAPEIIGDVLNTISYITNEERKKKFIEMNAGKFLVGYILGLPMAVFKTGGFSNSVEFFQLRPTGRADEDKKIFSTKKFKQEDIARCSVTCVGGPVAECMSYQIANGNNAADVNLLYELMNAVEPSLSPDKVQNHIRWSVLTAYEILKEHKDVLPRLVDAFENGKPLEECIAIIEGSDSA